MARDLITRMLDPKPVSRITIPEIMLSEWFTASHESNVESILVDNWSDWIENNNVFKNKEPKEMNAFHIISLSEGLYLSALFEEKRKEDMGEMMFTTTESASTVISRLEEVAAKAGEFEIKKAGESVVRMQGPRRGGLGIAAKIYAVSKSFLVVEVKMNHGDSKQFKQFCHNQLKPAIQDIVWTAGNPIPTS